MCIRDRAKAEHDNLTALEQTTGEAFMPNGNVYKRGGNHESQSVTSFNSFHNWLFHNDLTVIKVAPYVLYEKKKKRGNSYSAALNRDMNGLSGLTDSLFSGSSEWLRNAVINRVKNEDMQKSDKFFTTATASFTQDLKMCIRDRTRAEKPTRSCAKALAMFAMCSWPSLCEQSELQCWRRKRR